MPNTEKWGRNKANMELVEYAKLKGANLDSLRATFEGKGLLDVQGTYFHP